MTTPLTPEQSQALAVARVLAACGRNANAGRITRRLIADLASLDRCLVVSRPAAIVKPWAVDRRLDAAHLLRPTVGMNHARDAARHALYEAVHTGITRDPLSKASG